jgi:hypothetical protein
MPSKPDVALRKLEKKPQAPLSRQWGRKRDGTLIEYAGLDGRTYFCQRGLDGIEQWFIAEERKIKQATDAPGLAYRR